MQSKGDKECRGCGSSSGPRSRDMRERSIHADTMGKSTPNKQQGTEWMFLVCSRIYKERFEQRRDIV